MPSDILPPTTHSSSAPLRPLPPGASAPPAAASPYCLGSRVVHGGRISMLHGAQKDWQL